MGTKEEINKMFESLEKVIEEKTTPLSTDPPKADDLKTDPPATNPPSDDGNKTDPPSTDPPEDEATKYKREADELRQKLAEMESSKDKPPKTKPPTTDPPVSDEDFVKDLDLDDLTSDKSALNKVLNEIYRKAVVTARQDLKRSSETLAKAVPAETADLIKKQEALADISKKFYESNPDLKSFNKVVGVVFEDIATKNLDKTYPQILEMVGEETRKRLNLPKPKAQPDSKPNDNDKPPPLPRKKGAKVSQQPKPEPGSVFSQIEEMNKVLNS